QRLFDALPAIDGLLDVRREVLDAEAGAVEADPRQVLDIAVGDKTRIQLDRKVPTGSRAEVEMPAHGADQGLQFLAPEKVGCAAAEMQLDDFPTVLEERRCQCYFVPQPLEVAGAFF